MMKTFLQLLGADAPVFRRYALMAVLYGLLSGLTITALVPVLTRLLAGDTGGASLWIVVLLAGVIACWAWRRRVEKAGIGVGIAVLQGGRHRIGDHVARLPVGWFTPENTARLNHVVSHGIMEVAQLPAHVFTPVFGGGVTPVVMVAALFALDWRMGLIALAALPVLAGVFLIAARFGLRADEAFHRQAAHTSQRVVEFAQAQSMLRAFNGEGGGSRFLERAINRQRQSGRELIWMSMVSVVLNAWVVQVILAALLIAAVAGLNAYPGAALDAGEAISVVVSLVMAIRFIDPLLDVAGYGAQPAGGRAGDFGRPAHARAGCAAARARCFGGIARRFLPLRSGRAGGAAWGQPARRAGVDGRSGGVVRFGQDHAGAAYRAIFRRGDGSCSGWRRRCARNVWRASRRQDQPDFSGHLSVPGQRRRQYPYRQAGCFR
jgi:ATP-binding cassette subfamily B protein